MQLSTAAADDSSAAAAAENPHAGEGMVVLDIGGDIGALIVSAPESLVGAEIEICPAGRRGQTPDDGAGWWEGDWHSHGHADADGHGDRHGDGHERTHSHGPAWPHVAVLRRPPDGVAAAVFPGLRAGEYELWLRPAEPTALTAVVTGAAAAAVDWPSPAS